MNKKGSRLDFLVQLVATLSNSEALSLKQFLNCFDPNFDDNHKVKTLQLLEYIIENDFNVEEKEVVQEIYGENNTKALKFLCIRLIGKVYDFLMLDINVQRKDSFPGKVRQNIIVSKIVAQARINLLRGLSGDNLRLLNKAYKIAEEHEFYPQMTEILELKKRLLVPRLNMKEVEKITTKLREIDMIHRAVRNAEDIWHQLQYKNLITAGKPEVTPLMDIKMKEVKDDFEKFNSGWLGFFYYNLGVLKYTLSLDYASGIENYLNILQLTDRFKSIDNPNIRGGIYVQLSNLELHRAKPENALKYSKEALGYFRKNSINYFVAKEMEFAGYFYLKRYDEARECIEELMKNDKNPLHQVDQERRIFRLACLHFQTGDYPQALNELHKIKDLYHDKQGFNFGLRLLHIMISIELNDVGGIEHYIDSFRKLERKMAKKDLITERYAYIRKVLNSLVRNSFDFDKTYQSQKEVIELLESDDLNVGWSVNRAEYVSFSEWFLKKLKN